MVGLAEETKLQSGIFPEESSLTRKMSEYPAPKLYVYPTKI